MIVHGCNYRRLLLAVVGLVISAPSYSFADNASSDVPPAFATIFPAGGESGQSVDVTVGGSNLQQLKTLHCSVPGFGCESLEPNRFRLTIPVSTPAGLYDVWAVGDNGISQPRTFAVGNNAEQLEAEPNETFSTSMPVSIDTVVNGQIEKSGDADCFQFVGKKGQQLIVECWAERIDSKLRAVLELFNSQGKRLLVNRGYFGVDPLINFHVPADGEYVVKIHDLTSIGSAEHYYRLDVSTAPRVVHCVPNVIQRGKATRVTLYGWNLSSAGGQSATVANATGFDRLEVDIPATEARASWPLPVNLQPAQVILAGNAFPFHLAGSSLPVLIGLTDVPVVIDHTNNHAPSLAQEIAIPSEVSGQLTAGDECDWFAIQAQRGEVLFIEGYGQRIDSPVDLQISVLDVADESGQIKKEGSKQWPQELVRLSDEVRNIGGTFPTKHLDPSGRWVCPADGRYLIAVRNLNGGLQDDPRRIYRLSVRRAEHDFHIVAAPRNSAAAGINVPRGGRQALDLLALRERGFEGEIRVTAKDLPAGVDCPDVWLGPGVERATIVVSADKEASLGLGELILEGVAESRTTENRHLVRGGVVVRSGTPTVWGRVASQMPLVVTGEAALRITADGHEPVGHHLYGQLSVKHSPGSVLDVAVQIDRQDANHQAPVKLIGVGLPDAIGNQTAIVPAGKQKGYLSFYLPPSLAVGHYSLVVRAETTVHKAEDKTETIIVHSNPITFNVRPAAFRISVDPFAVTQAKRGEVIQIGYTAKRINGFIGKMHTELAVPGIVTDVAGLRGRGETFVSQTDKGSLQIIINDDAPLGRQSFLRLFTVGVVEDEPTYYGSRFLNLEIVE